MAKDWLLEPVSDEEPCGPDLDMSDDPEFVDYYFDALGRLPERYVTPGVERSDGSRSDDIIFDPKSVKHSDEAKTIEGFLKRSRDIRLMALRAQFEGLAGRLVPMSVAFKGVADMIETFGDDLHPAMHEDVSGRRDAVNELGNNMTIVLPLQFAGLNGTTEVTLRRLKVATGEANAFAAGEEDLSAAGMQDAISSPGNRKKVDDIHGALMVMTEAIGKIISLCKTHESKGFTPALGPTQKVLEEMRAAIAQARPDLRGAEADLESFDGGSEGENSGENPPNSEDGSAGDTGGAATAAVDLPAGAIASHNQARKALEVCEQYFRTKEPSSAALLLVAQARLLIGMPLMQAMEVLLPESAAKAMISFGPQTGFAISGNQLKALSGQPAPQSGDDEGEGSAPKADTLAETSGLMRAVEEFFRRHEKSSPVPILLQRARSYLDKDFQALIEELIPRVEPPPPKSPK